MHEGHFTDALNLCEISVLSGTRPAGRMVCREARGRKRNGLLYLRDGEALFFDPGGQKLTATGGDLVFLPKGKLYRMVYHAPETTFVLVNFELLGRNGSDVSLARDISVLARDSKALNIAGLMLQLEQGSAARDLPALLRRKELCYRLMSIAVDALEQAADEERLPRQITAGVRLLRQTYPENLPVEAFAEASHLSLNRFRELFRAQFGISPVKYRNRLRVERARELLAEEDVTVAEAAYAAGFENLGYFYRCYRRETGQTPAEAKGKTRA